MSLNLWILLFADDVVIFTEHEHELRSIFNRFKVFCDVNGLSINADKTELMICNFGSKLDL
jgi:hypothetical protein